MVSFALLIGVKEDVRLLMIFQIYPVHPNLLRQKTSPVRKIESAKRCLQQQSKGSEAKKRRFLSYSIRDEPSNSDILKKEIDDLKEQLRSKTNEVNQLSDLVKTLKIQNETYQSQLQKFAHTTEKTTFSYKCLKKNPEQFFT